MDRKEYQRQYRLKRKLAETAEQREVRLADGRRRSAERRAADPEAARRQRRESMRRSYARRREHFLEKAKAYAASNRDAIQQRRRVYYVMNREALRARGRDRYASKFGTLVELRRRLRACSNWHLRDGNVARSGRRRGREVDHAFEFREAAEHYDQWLEMLDDPEALAASLAG